MLVQTHHTKSIKILQIPEKQFCIGVYFIELEVPKQIYVKNKEILYIKKYSNQVGLAHSTCSTINPFLASSLIIKKLTSSFSQKNKCSRV